MPGPSPDTKRQLPLGRWPVANQDPEWLTPGESYEATVSVGYHGTITVIEASPAVRAAMADLDYDRSLGDLDAGWALHPGLYRATLKYMCELTTDEEPEFWFELEAMEPVAVIDPDLDGRPAR